MVQEIRAKRLELGLSQEKLGIILGYKKGVARVMIWNWEHGKQRVPRDKLKQVSTLLKIPIEEMLGKRGSKDGR